ncbi:MAG: hypothetical protein QOE40_367 [Actinomycetota bacterium]|nr:hypothetical protein [Actinomycetota bacterium]
MTSMKTRRFFMTNGVANRLVIPLLNSRAGGYLGRRLAVVEYLGRRTGQRHQLVTQYTLDGTTVRISVGMAERKTWWRNFQEPHAVRLRLAGVSRDATGRALRDGDHVSVIAELACEGRRSVRRPAHSRTGGRT